MITFFIQVPRLVLRLVAQAQLKNVVVQEVSDVVSDPFFDLELPGLRVFSQRLVASGRAGWPSVDEGHAIEDADIFGDGQAFG